MTSFISQPAENYLKNARISAGVTLETSPQKLGLDAGFNIGSIPNPLGGKSPAKQESQYLAQNNDYDNPEDYSGKDETTKLKMINKKLQSQLKELSVQLDAALERAKTYKNQGKNQLTGDADIILKAKEKEIQNAQAQINMYKKEIAGLKMKFDGKNGFEKQVDLENQLRDSERRNAELTKEIRGLQKVQTDQGKALERITSESEYPQKIKQCMEELKVYKEKLRDAEERQKREEKNTKAQFDLARKLETQVRDLTKQLANSKNPNELPKKPSDVVTVEDKIVEMEAMRQAYEKARDTDFKKNKIAMTQQEKRIQELLQQNEAFQKEIREKEQENRLSSLKIKELQRLVKHTQLKPITAEGQDNDDDNTSKQSKSTNNDAKKLKSKKSPKPMGLNKGEILAEEKTQESPKQKHTRTSVAKKGSIDMKSPNDSEAETDEVFKKGFDQMKKTIEDELDKNQDLSSLKDHIKEATNIVNSVLEKGTDNVKRLNNMKVEAHNDIEIGSAALKIGKQSKKELKEAFSGDVDKELDKANSRLNLLKDDLKDMGSNDTGLRKGLTVFKKV